MSNIRYGKPNMNNLPYELGKSIFEEMDNSPKVDRQERKKEALELQKKMMDARRKEEHGKQE